MRLSVLDVMPTGGGLTAVEALPRAASLAQHVDTLGYHRLWFAEHHGMALIASSVPEILIAHVAPLTQHLRIGAGGVMLPNHAPLRVVEQYRTLHALHPGRIDLGIGRAAGTDSLTSAALSGRSGTDFGQLLAETLAFEEGTFPGEHPFRTIRVTPSGVTLPPIWILGSSGGSAGIAGQLGTGYAFAAHFSPVEPGPAVARYRATFEPSEAFPQPQVLIATSVVCAGDGDTARAHCVILAHAMQELLTGTPVPLPSLGEARRCTWSEAELRMRMGPVGPQMIFGSSDHVTTQLQSLADRVQADELMIMTVVHDHEARLASYRMLAESFALDSPHSVRRRLSAPSSDGMS